MPPPKPAAPLQRKPLPPRPPSLVGEGIVTLSSISDAIVRSIAAYKVIAEVDVLLHSSIDRTLLFPLASDMREYSRQVQVPRARSIYHEMCRLTSIVVGLTRPPRKPLRSTEPSTFELRLPYNESAASPCWISSSSSKYDSRASFTSNALTHAHCYCCCFNHDQCEREAHKLRPLYEEALDHLHEVLCDQQREFVLLQSAIELFVSIKIAVDTTEEKMRVLQQSIGHLLAWVSSVRGSSTTDERLDDASLVHWHLLTVALRLP